MAKNTQLILVLAFVLLLISTYSKAQNFNRPTPNTYPEYEFIAHDTSYNGIYLTAPFHSPSAGFPYLRNISILDSNGYLAWYSSIQTGGLFDFKYHPDHNLFSYIEIYSNSSWSFKTIDTNFTLVDSLNVQNYGKVDNHEFIILDNGNYMISARKDSLVDLSSHTFNGQPGDDSTYIRGFVLQEFDKSTHNLIFEWNSNDYIDPTEAYDSVYGYKSTDFDYCHGNAIEQTSDGGYMMSLRHTNSIYKIDSIGNVQWKLGGKDNSFTFVNDNGFSGQHDIRELENGNVSLFDNGNSNIVKKSRAVEYSLDTINWTATKVWEYIYDDSLYSKAMGSNQTTSESYHLINYGLINRPYPNFVLIDENNELVSELLFRDTIYSYRSFTYDYSPKFDKPKVSCSNNGGTITLSVENNFNKYTWSTGESTQSIEVVTEGEYQVWVNKGIGMIGSEPIIIDDISSYCMTTGLITDLPPKDELKDLYDLQGRKINFPQKDQLYIFQFQNGRCVLGIW